jgi:hypothetical protein
MADPKQVEYLSLLQERNKLKRLINAKDNNIDKRERGFSTHFAGANASPDSNIRTNVTTNSNANISKFKKQLTESPTGEDTNYLKLKKNLVTNSPAIIRKDFHKEDDNSTNISSIPGFGPSGVTTGPKTKGWSSEKPKFILGVQIRDDDSPKSPSKFEKKIESKSLFTDDNDNIESINPYDGQSTGNADNTPIHSPTRETSKLSLVDNTNKIDPIDSKLKEFNNQNIENKEYINSYNNSNKIDTTNISNDDDDDSFYVEDFDNEDSDYIDEDWEDEGILISKEGPLINIKDKDVNESIDVNYDINNDVGGVKEIEPSIITSSLLQKISTLDIKAQHQLLQLLGNGKLSIDSKDISESSNNIKKAPLTPRNSKSPIKKSNSNKSPVKSSIRSPVITPNRSPIKSPNRSNKSPVKIKNSLTAVLSSALLRNSHEEEKIIKSDDKRIINPFPIKKDFHEHARAMFHDESNNELEIVESSSSNISLLNHEDKKNEIKKEIFIEEEKLEESSKVEIIEKLIQLSIRIKICSTWSKAKSACLESIRLRKKGDYTLFDLNLFEVTVYNGLQKVSNSSDCVRNIQLLLYPQRSRNINDRWKGNISLNEPLEICLKGNLPVNVNMKDLNNFESISSNIINSYELLIWNGLGTLPTSSGCKDMDIYVNQQCIWSGELDPVDTTIDRRFIKLGEGTPTKIIPLEGFKTNKKIEKFEIIETKIVSEFNTAEKLLTSEHLFLPKNNNEHEILSSSSKLSDSNTVPSWLTKLKKPTSAASFKNMSQIPTTKISSPNKHNKDNDNADNNNNIQRSISDNVKERKTSARRNRNIELISSSQPNDLSSSILSLSANIDNNKNNVIDNNIDFKDKSIELKITKGPSPAIKKRRERLNNNSSSENLIDRMSLKDNEQKIDSNLRNSLQAINFSDRNNRGRLGMENDSIGISANEYFDEEDRVELIKVNSAINSPKSKEHKENILKKRSLRIEQVQDQVKNTLANLAGLNFLSMKNKDLIVSNNNNQFNNKQNDMLHQTPTKATDLPIIKPIQYSSPETLKTQFHKDKLPTLPSGKVLKFEILSTWGDNYYVGLNGIDIFDENGYSLTSNIYKTNYKTNIIKSIRGNPSDINVLPEYNDDPRKIYNLIDGVNFTRDDLHVWLAPLGFMDKELKKSECNDENSIANITITFEKETTLSMLRMFNYNKSRTHSHRGVKNCRIYFDDKVIFDGEICIANGLLSSVDSLSEIILFTSNEDALVNIAKHDEKSGYYVNDTTEQCLDKLRNIKSIESRPRSAELKSPSPSNLSNLQDINGSPQQQNRPGTSAFSTSTNVNNSSINNIISTPTSNSKQNDNIIQTPSLTELKIKSLNKSPNKSPVTPSTPDDLGDLLSDLNELTSQLHFNKDDDGDNDDDIYKQIIEEEDTITPKKQAISSIRTTFPTNQVELSTVSDGSDPNKKKKIILSENDLITCQKLTLSINSTWGDDNYVGLCGIELLLGRNLLVAELNKSCIHAEPRDLSEVGCMNDPRVPENLINGINNTCDDRYMWIIPYTKGNKHQVTFDLGQLCNIGGIRIWNYNSDSELVLRGVKIVTFLADNKTIGQWTLRQGPGCDGINFMQSILFRDVLNPTIENCPNISIKESSQSSSYIRYISPAIKQDYETQQFPTGLLWKFSFLENWCDGYYMGLDAISFIDASGKVMNIFDTGAKVFATPHSLQDLSSGVDDPRVPERLFSTSNNELGSRTWLAPLSRCMTKEERDVCALRQLPKHYKQDTKVEFKFSTDNTLFVLFQYAVRIAGIR